MPSSALPSSSFANVQQFLRQKRATGQTVSPTEERAAWGGYWDAQVRNAGVDRRLALEQKRLNMVKRQYDDQAELDEGAARIKGITDLATSAAMLSDMPNRGNKGAQTSTAAPTAPAAPVGMLPKKPAELGLGEAPAQAGPSNESALGQIDSGALNADPGVSSSATSSPSIGLPGMPSAGGVAQGLGAIGIAAGLAGGPIGGAIATGAAVGSAALSIGNAVYGGISALIGNPEGTQGSGGGGAAK